MLIPLPRYVNFIEWTQALQNNYPLINFPICEKNESWRAYCQSLSIIFPGNNIPLATKIIYPGEKDWVKWVEDAMGNLQLINAV